MLGGYLNGRFIYAVVGTMNQSPLSYSNGMMTSGLQNADGILSLVVRLALARELPAVPFIGAGTNRWAWHQFTLETIEDFLSDIRC